MRAPELLKELAQTKRILAESTSEQCPAKLATQVIDIAVDAVERTERQASYIIMLLRIVPAPDCIDCYSEMTLDEEVMLYMCTCHGGCTCTGNAPCSHCAVSIDAADWVENYCEVAEEGHKAGTFEKMAIRRELERGPGAVASAKPVTKFVVSCQGDYWDGVENL